jgi:hypothetical protein
MVDIIKQDMTDIWAVAGDVVAPDSAKVRAGWAVEAVPRQWWNFIENRQDSNISYMLQKGIPEWDATTEYLNVKSYVQRNGIIYKSIQTGTNQDPVTATAYWTKAFVESSTALEALKPLTPAADRLPYFTGASTSAVTTFTAFARTLLDDVDAPAMRATLAAQVAHANLTALSGVTASTNVLPYFNSTTTMTGTTLTAFGRSLIDDVDAAAGRSTLGLGTVATYDVTTSPTDATTDRIIKVGDFGENGGVGITLGSGINADSLSPGFYVFPNGGINLPISAAFYVKHYGYPVAGYGKQLAWNITTNVGYSRFQAATVWSAWETDATIGDINSAINTLTASSGINLTSAPLSSDLNTITVTGIQRFTGSTANIPVASSVGTVFTMSYDALYKTQLAQMVDVGSGGNRIFNRTLNNGTWGAWQEGVNVNGLNTALSSYALKGANSDITSLSGLTTVLSVAQGGTGTNTSTGTGSTVRSASPTFTGTPLSTTAAPGTNTTQIATTAFVTAADNLKANLASPTFTGLPLAPTAAVNTNNTQIATTAYTVAQISASAQSSTLDGTAGKLLIQGAFGLGTLGADSSNSISNITTTFRTGFYKFAGGTTGAPPQFAGAGGSLIVHSLGGNFVQQIAISVPTSTDVPMMVIRHYDTSGNPGPWRTFYHNSNIVGTVSQTSSVPTGAIIETGSNANGTYTKFADGTMICRGTRVVGGHVMTTALGAALYYNPSGITATAFPATFITAPQVVINIKPSGAAVWHSVIGSPSTNNGPTIYAISVISATLDIDITQIAYGRWF